MLCHLCCSGIKVTGGGSLLKKNIYIEKDPSLLMDLTIKSDSRWMKLYRFSVYPPGAWAGKGYVYVSSSKLNSSQGHSQAQEPTGMGWLTSRAVNKHAQPPEQGGWMQISNGLWDALTPKLCLGIAWETASWYRPAAVKFQSLGMLSHVLGFTNRGTALGWLAYPAN